MTAGNLAGLRTAGHGIRMAGALGLWNAGRSINHAARTAMPGGILPRNARKLLVRCVGTVVRKDTCSGLARSTRTDLDGINQLITMSPRREEELATAKLKKEMPIISRLSEAVLKTPKPGESRRRAALTKMLGKATQLPELVGAVSRGEDSTSLRSPFRNGRVTAAFPHRLSEVTKTKSSTAMGTLSR